MQASVRAFANFKRESRWSRDQVGVAWAEGRYHGGGNGALRTDGQTLWSYGHEVGYTEADGRKVARDCRYSVTTTKQLGTARALADEIVACEGHGPAVRR